MKLILFILLIIFLATCAEASVSLQMSYYNSEDAMSTSLDGYNLEFESFCTLFPDSILYKNGGSSQQKDAKYSYSLSLNDESLTSSAQTDSGKFSWGGNVEASIEQNLIDVSSRSSVEDGHLSLDYGNNDLKVQEFIEVKNSNYIQKSRLNPNLVESVGSGSTLYAVPGLTERLKEKFNPDNNAASTAKSGEDTSSDPVDRQSTEEKEPQIQGMRHLLTLQHSGEVGSIFTDVMGETQAQWETNVLAPASGDLFYGVRVRGISMEPMEDLSMVGYASDFPLQILPPGKVKISYKDKDDPTVRNLIDLLQESFQKFDAQYPGRIAPALWYDLNNTYYNEIPLDYDPTDSSPSSLELYNFGIGFTVKSSENSCPGI